MNVRKRDGAASTHIKRRVSKKLQPMENSME